MISKIAIIKPKDFVELDIDLDEQNIIVGDDMVKIEKYFTGTETIFKVTNAMNGYGQNIMEEYKDAIIQIM